MKGDVRMTEFKGISDYIYIGNGETYINSDLFMKIDTTYLRVCPRCGAEFIKTENGGKCPECGLEYKILMDGYMIWWNAPLSDEEIYKLWKMRARKV